jgi:hypothetical protein
MLSSLFFNSEISLIIVKSLLLQMKIIQVTALLLAYLQDPKYTLKSTPPDRK